MKLLAAAIFIVATPAFARVQLEPPAEYDHPFAGEHVVYEVKLREVRNICSDAFGYWVPVNVEGCSWRVGDDVCFNVVATNPKRASSVAALKRHERAHCNGWKH